MSVKIRFFTLEGGAPLSPPREGDGGIDLASSVDLIVAPHTDAVISTSIKCAIPLGWIGLLMDRSSTALKGLETHAGVIDSSYRGEIKIVVSNRSSQPFEVSRGMRIAQMIVVPCCTSIETVSSEELLGKTDRGEAGFGSTGS